MKQRDPARHGPAAPGHRTLGICWEDEQLRFWDPVEKRYLRTHQEEKHDRITAEAQADAAEARMKELEEELRRSREQ